MKLLTPEQRRLHIAAVIASAFNVFIGSIVLATATHPSGLVGLFVGYSIYAGARSTCVLRRKGRASVFM